MLCSVASLLRQNETTTIRSPGLTDRMETHCTGNQNTQNPEYIKSIYGSYFLISEVFIYLVSGLCVFERGYCCT